MQQLRQRRVLPRRQALHAWVGGAYQVPRVRYNADWLTFTGLVDRMRESSVMVGAGKELGVVLRVGGGGFAEVTECAGGVLPIGAKVGRGGGWVG